MNDINHTTIKFYYYCTHSLKQLSVKILSLLKNRLIDLLYVEIRAIFLRTVVELDYHEK